jgi:hypothetical protein
LLLFAGLGFLALASTAAANHSLTDLTSTGPSGGNGAYDATFTKTSVDGKRALFYTDESLVPGDTDGGFCCQQGVRDLYSRSGGTTELISTGPNGDGPQPPTSVMLSRDGQTVFFETRDPLVSQDTDGSPDCGNPMWSICKDVYARSGGTTTLVSAGGNGPFDTTMIPWDGDQVYFMTDEPLVPADTDTRTDVYQSSGGPATLVTPGTATDCYFRGASKDGTHVFITTADQLVLTDLNNQDDIYDRSGGTYSFVGPGNVPSDTEAVSADGSRVLLETGARLVNADHDNAQDVYQWSGGTYTLLSGGANNGTTASFFGASADGTHVIFWTVDRLVGADNDSSFDLYEWFNGTTTLVSTGPSGGNGAFNAAFDAISADGARVLFDTAESLVPSDTDSVTDLYQRAGGTTTLVSTGPSGGNGAFSAGYASGSKDESRVFFGTQESLVPSDTDSAFDVYERFAGATTLISVGPTGGNAPTTAFMLENSASADGTHAFFNTKEPLVASDTDTSQDVYDRSVAYETPQSASPISVSLVPLFRQCGTGASPANGQHSPPLSVPSCNPPVPSSNLAFVGPASIGSAALTVVAGNPGTVADEADVTTQVNVTDVRAGSTSGPDYDPTAGPEMTYAARVRITDRSNGPSASDPATATDLDLSVPVDCVGTAGGVGATCAANTSIDAVTPGAIKEGTSAIFQVFRARLNDPGANGVRGDSDDRIFAHQGIYIP